MASGGGMDGYFTGTDYPAQLVPLMAPANIGATAAWQGVVPPDLGRGFHCLDIGCGRGAALVLAAASHPAGTFEGIDGMESHIAAARRLAQGVPNIAFRHAPFAETLGDATPDCDLIVMHGVLSWAGPAARREAMDLAAARLRPGGLLAVSYNALPGGARQMAFQHLLRTFGPKAGGAPAEQFCRAFERIREMADAGYEAIGRDVVRRLADLAEEAPPEYFLHEYMHDGWQPFWAADIRAALTGRRLEPLGSVDFLRLRPDLCLSFPQARFAETMDPEHLDLMVDIGMDVVFRSDLYAKSPRRGDAEDLRRHVWLGASVDPEAPVDIEGPVGPVTPDADLSRRVLAALAEGPLSLPSLLERVPGPATRETVECLLAGQRLLPLSAPAADMGVAAALNGRLAAMAGAGGDLPIEALAGAGGPVYMPRARMALLNMGVDDALHRAGHDRVFRERTLPAGVNPESDRARDALEAGVAEAATAFRRLAVAGQV